MNLKVLLIALFAFCGFGTVSAMAADGPWNHNGSTVYMTDGTDDYPQRLKIWYTSPRSGMRAVGVRNGTTLFTGTEYADGSVEGTAYVFKSGCKPAGYAVSGSFSGDTNRLVLSGAAPVRGNGCKVVGYSNNKNSVLVFEYQGIID